MNHRKIVKDESRFPPGPLERFTDHVLGRTLVATDPASYKRLKEWYKQNKGKTVDFNQAVRDFEPFVPEGHKADYFGEAAWFFLAEKNVEKAYEYADKSLRESGRHQRQETLVAKNLAECIMQKKPLPDLRKLRREGISEFGDLSDMENDIMEIHYHLALRWINDYAKDYFGADYSDLREIIEGSLKSIEFKMKGAKGIIFEADWWKKDQ